MIKTDRHNLKGTQDELYEVLPVYKSKLYLCKLFYLFIIKTRDVALNVPHTNQFAAFPELFLFFADI